MDFALSPNWHLETGLALNTTQYAGRFIWYWSGSKLAYSFGTILSPRAGVSYSFTKNKTLLLP
jgi:iron complex outermembrane receptor protein